MRKILTTLFLSLLPNLASGESSTFVRVDSCADSLSPEACSFVVTHPKEITDKAILFFPGGDMPCDNLSRRRGKSLQRLLDYYSDRGYLAIAACPFLTMKAAVLPSMGQQERFEKLVESIRQHQKVKEYWTGKNLLISGLSQGATTPVVLMARTDMERSRNWQGETFTGACFLEGVYDTSSLNDFFLEHPLSCGFMRRSGICQRYYDRRFCPKELPPSEAVNYDTVSEVSPKEFAIGDWKMVECGSALQKPKCAFPHGDWIPAGPIQRLCNNLQASDGHRCEWGSLPQESHLSCAFSPQGLAACAQWFESKLPQ